LWCGLYNSTGHCNKVSRVIEEYDDFHALIGEMENGIEAIENEMREDIDYDAE
jgi:hypothetical protein